MSEIRQRKPGAPSSTQAAAQDAALGTAGDARPEGPAGAGPDPGLDPNSQFAGGSVDLSLGPWLTTALLVLPCIVVYFNFWPLIKEELDKGEPLFGIPQDVKDDLAEFWRRLCAKLGFR